MKRKFLQDISVNSLQVLINQFCGFIIFYVLSVHLGKEEFGAFNWSLAVLLTAFNILSGGMDQLVIKKIASGNDASQIISTYLMHVFFAGILFYVILFSGQLIFHQPHHLLLLLGLGKCMIFISSPFKQLATGLEKFRSLMLMSICSNVVRSLLLILLALFFHLELYWILIIFIIGDITELILCLIITRYNLKIPVVLQWNTKNYVTLIRESFPQAGVVIFTSFIARFDWILLGLIASNLILAEYSFAYKVFEISTLPLLVIAPVLIPRFTRMFHSPHSIPPANILQRIFILLRFEMIIASLTILVLNICWIPVIDFISLGKYGMVNQINILLLSASLPFLYFNNFLWTINFSKGHLRRIFNIIGITCLINVCGDIILIPFYKAEGAAAAFLISIAIQSYLYFRVTTIAELKYHWYSLIICPACAALSMIIALYLFKNVYLVLLMAVLSYFLSIVACRQIKKKDWHILKESWYIKGNLVT